MQVLGRIRISAAATLALLAGVLPAGSPASAQHKRKLPPDFTEILSRMDDAAKNLKTLSADLAYTKVTVLVNDKSTEVGKLLYHKSKSPQILISFHQPDPKTILFKKNKAEIYLPKINQIQEYNVGRHGGLVQQFLLLGFGTETGDLKKEYDIRFVSEEELDGDTTAVLELTPRKENIAAQLAKVQLWVSEESWLPVQQKFFEPGGDYLIARYTAVKVNRELPASAFQIPAGKDAKRVKIN